MKKIVLAVIALALALIPLFPGTSEAGRSLNHNQTRLRG